MNICDPKKLKLLGKMERYIFSTKNENKIEHEQGDRNINIYL
jgi:hypothetical protein